MDMTLEPLTFEAITDKVQSGERVTREEGLWLIKEGDMLAMGRLAQRARFRYNPEPVVTFVIDSNPNYTNYCETDCVFCAFYRRPGAQDGYWLTVEQVMEKIRGVVERGATTVLLQGGHNAEIPFDYYLSLVRETRRQFPQVT